MSEYKLIKGKIVTGGRSIEKIREANKGQNMSEEDFQNIQKAYEQFNGATAIFRIWQIDDYKVYYLSGWDKENDQKIMMGMYYAEQCNPFQDIYKNDLEKFKIDWVSGEYDTQGAFVLDEKDIEVIQILAEAGGEE